MEVVRETTVLITAVVDEGSELEPVSVAVVLCCVVEDAAEDAVEDAVEELVGS